jgi:hypothetical protein
MFIGKTGFKYMDDENFIKLLKSDKGLKKVRATEFEDMIIEEVLSGFLLT